MFLLHLFTSYTTNNCLQMLNFCEDSYQIGTRIGFEDLDDAAGAILRQNNLFVMKLINTRKIKDGYASYDVVFQGRPEPSKFTPCLYALAFMRLMVPYFLSAPP